MRCAKNRTASVAAALRKESSQSGPEPVQSSIVPLPEETTIHDALVLMEDQGIVAAPVLDEAGQPVGVLSRTHLDEPQAEYLESSPVELTYLEVPGPSTPGRRHPASDRGVPRIARGESDPNRFRR